MQSRKRHSQKIIIIAIILIMIMQLLNPLVQNVSNATNATETNSDSDGTVTLEDIKKSGRTVGVGEGEEKDLTPAGTFVYKEVDGKPHFYLYYDEGKVFQFESGTASGGTGLTVFKMKIPNAAKLSDEQKNYAQGIIDELLKKYSDDISSISGLSAQHASDLAKESKADLEKALTEAEGEVFTGWEHNTQTDTVTYIYKDDAGNVKIMDVKYASQVVGSSTGTYTLIGTEEEIKEALAHGGQKVTTGADLQKEHGLNTEGDYEKDPDDYGLGGVLLRPFMNMIDSIADIVINALQITLMEPEKLDNSSTYAISNYLFRSGEKKPDEYKGEVKSGIEITVDTEDFEFGWLNLRKQFYYPNAKYSPEEIFSNTSQNKKISAFNINFFSNSDSNDSSEGESSGTESNGEGEGSSTLNLRKTIAGWYLALRNLAIVGLLCVLVYMGIRILISATAADKAKYKQLLKDWLVALILLFSMHYIMVLTVTVVETIVTGISPDSASGVSIKIDKGEGENFKTNLIGAARFQTQYKDIGRRTPYIIMYLALVAYTVVFTVFYFKRVLMMAFLTMIAPLVALTYPIDKITDGKAQAFNAWFREYVYNALIQPFHLIIYIVFVSNALNFAKNNVFYMIASLWFVMKAEKILRGFFGFNKASGGTMEALHTVGLASMLNTIAKGGPRLRGAANDSGKGSGGDDTIRYASGVDAKQLGEGMGIGSVLDSEDSPSPSPSPSPSQDSSLSSGSRLSSGSGSGSGSRSSSGSSSSSSSSLSSGSRSSSSSSLSSSSSSSSSSGSGSSTSKDEKKAQNGLRRVLNHRLGGMSRKAPGMVKRGLKGAAKLGLRTTFTAGAGALAGAVALASGGDFGAALAAASAGAGIGGRVGNWMGDRGEGIINRVDEDFDIADASGERRRTKEANKKMYDSDEYYNYVRDSMIKADGEIPTSDKVEEKLEEYRPFIERGFNIQEAEKAGNVAKRLGIDNNEAALTLAAGKEREITRAVLNKEADRKQYMANLQAELVDQGYSSAQAKIITDREFSFMERYYGVEDHQIKEAARQKEEKKAARVARQNEARRQQQERQQNDLKVKENAAKEAEKKAKKVAKEAKKKAEKEADMKRQAELIGEIIDKQSKENRHKQNLEASRARRQRQEEVRGKMEARAKKTGNSKLNSEMDSYRAKDLGNGKKIYLKGNNK